MSNRLMLWRVPLLMVIGAFNFFLIPARGEILPYTGGHGDIGVKYEEGALQFRFDFGSAAIVGGSPIGVGRDQYRPEEILAVAGASTYSELSDSIAALFGAGTTHAYAFGLSSSQVHPYLGLAAMDPTLSSADWINPDPNLSWSGFLGRINYEFTGMSYSGVAADPRFVYFSSSSTGEPRLIYSSATGESGVVAMPIPGHGHYAWGFSDPGIYEISLRARGTHVRDGYREASGTIRFEIQPVPEPASIALAGCGAAVLLIGFLGRSKHALRRAESTCDEVS